MGKNRHIFQILTALILMLGANQVFAQEQVLPLGTGVKNYAVDTSGPNGTSQPDGTPGSTYDWSIEPITGTVIGTFPPTGIYNTNNNLTDNKATIDWSQATPGDYRVKVIESNASCDVVTVTFTVRITNVDATGLVTWTNINICRGGDVVFHVNGAIPNAVLHYSLTNATQTTGTVNIDSDGNAIINATHDSTDNNTVVVTLDKLVLNNTDIEYTSPKPTGTAIINIIVTSPIVALD